MGWNFSDFSDFYDCSGTAGLIGENGLNFTEQGVVPEEPVGKFGVARGPCDGNFGGVGRGFSRTPAAAEPWDTRVSQGFTRCSLVGWYRLDLNTGDQEFASQARLAAASNTKQWMLRCVMQDGTDDIQVLFLWDHVANVFRVAAGIGVPQGRSGAMPLGVWCMIGFSVDLTAMKARLFSGVPGESPHYDERAIDPAWNAFQATALDVVMLGIGSGNSTEGIGGDIDHVTWTAGTAYAKGDFLNHWQGGPGLARALYQRNADLPIHLIAAQLHAARGAR